MNRPETAPHLLNVVAVFVCPLQIDCTPRLILEIEAQREIGIAAGFLYHGFCDPAHACTLRSGKAKRGHACPAVRKPIGKFGWDVIPGIFRKIERKIITGFRCTRCKMARRIKRGIPFAGVPVVVGDKDLGVGLMRNAVKIRKEQHRFAAL